jgi:hypothetical protein
MRVEVTVEYEPTPEELAIEFCKLYEDGQAKFFNRVAEIFNHPKHSLTMQLEYISQSKLLTNEATHLMGKIGEYAEHNR